MILALGAFQECSALGQGSAVGVFGSGEQVQTVVSDES